MTEQLNWENESCISFKYYLKDLELEGEWPFLLDPFIQDDLQNFNWSYISIFKTAVSYRDSGGSSGHRSRNMPLLNEKVCNRITEATISDNIIQTFVTG